MFSSMMLLTCLLLLVTRCLAVVTYPTNVEFDIVSPQQNATYKFDKLIPIVVAIQNPEAASLLDAGLYFELYKADNASVIVHPSIPVSLSNTDLVGNTTVVTHYMSAKYVKQKIEDLDGLYMANWSIEARTCLTMLDYAYHGSIYFNVDKKATDPDIYSLAKNCAAVQDQAVIYNMNGTLDKYPADRVITQTGPLGCQDLGEVDTTPQPCRVQIDEEGGKTITKEIKKLYTTISDASPLQQFNGGSLAVAALVGWTSFWIFI